MTNYSNYPKDPFGTQEAQKYSQPVPSREYILQQMKQVGSPLRLHELIKLLDVLSEHEQGFSNRLKAMVRDGQLLCNRKQMYGIATAMDQIRGRIIGHQDGHGFVENDQHRLFLSHREMRKVMHGDIVLAFVMSKTRRNQQEGAISEVLERSTSNIVGRMYRENGLAFVRSLNKRQAHDIMITDPPKTQNEDLVSVKITSYPTLKSPPIGEVVEVISPKNNTFLITEMAVRSYQIPHEWTEAQIKKAEKFSPKISTLAINNAVKKGRNDLRHLPFCTIDGKDAKDFDDAIYCKKNDQGWKLLVSIADVAHYIKPEDLLDKEAYLRGTSVYLPSKVIPMLPENLSNGLCSLNPDQDRFCVTCEMMIDEQGRITSCRFYESVIRSAKRLTYRETDQLLKSETHQQWQSCTEALKASLLALRSLYIVQKKQRQKRGSIDIESNDVEIILSPNGKIKKIKPVKPRRSHKIVEECMLMANVCAAEYLDKKGIPLLYRVHDSSKMNKLDALKQLLDDLNIPFKHKPPFKVKDFSQLLKKVRKQPSAKIIETAILRSFKKAVYSVENRGHFGLNYPFYAHFTSPIRRYPDLMVHRAIKEVIYSTNINTNANAQETSEVDTSLTTTQQIKQLDVIAEHCSYTERRADELSREVVHALKCEYASQKIGETFAGTISNVVPFGFFVHLETLLVEGLVHISSLGKDYFHHDEIHHCLIGANSGVHYTLGQSVTVQLDSVDLEEKRINLKLV